MDVGNQISTETRRRHLLLSGTFSDFLYPQTLNNRGLDRVACASSGIVDGSDQIKLFTPIPPKNPFTAKWRERKMKEMILEFQLQRKIEKKKLFAVLLIGGKSFQTHDVSGSLNFSWDNYRRLKFFFILALEKEFICLLHIFFLGGEGSCRVQSNYLGH